ncbi:MAG: hypothetical protein RLZZ292_3351 [Bacteroidota bacterium]|jgi:adenine-specific DNA-methyltransferase
MVFLENSKGIPVQDIWLDYLDINNQNTKGTGYPTEKNPDLLKRIIEASSDNGDLVLDCFAGSGTTLAAADELNRKWIGIDSSTEAINTILDRFYKGIEAIGDFVAKKDNTSHSFNLFEVFPEIPVNYDHNIIHNFTFYTEKYNAELFEDKINKIKNK